MSRAVVETHAYAWNGACACVHTMRRTPSAPIDVVLSEGHVKIGDNLHTGNQRQFEVHKGKTFHT